MSSNRVSERKHTSNFVFKDICAKAVAKACVGSPKGPNRFILDSGASFHIISRTDLTEDQINSIYKMDAAIEIETVNGTVSTTEVVDLVLPGLWDHEITAISQWVFVQVAKESMSEIVHSRWLSYTVRN